jgi:hypothetical protein
MPLWINWLQREKIICTRDVCTYRSIKKNSAYKIAREVAETRIEINETGGLVKKIVLLIIY